MLHRGLVGGVDLAVVVRAALEVPDVGVGEVLDQLLRPRVAAEEVLADVGAVVGLVGLEVAVRRGVHEVDQRAVAVGVQQPVPLTAPDDLDDVPARAAEERLELLDDLAVAVHRPVEALQVAVDDEGQVVETLGRRDVDGPARLRLVHLAVAEERPRVLLAGVLHPAVVQVAVEARLEDRVDRAEAHRHRRVLPEPRHQPRVRVRRQAAARPGVRELLAEAVEVLGAQAALEEGAGVDAGGGVALDVDVVAAAGVVLAAEEPVEADLVQRRRRRVGRDVPADPDPRALRAVHHRRRVPPDPRPVAPLGLLVAREPRLLVGRDGVDVVRGVQRRHRDAALPRALEQLQHDVAGALLALPLEHRVEGLDPLRGLVRIDVGQVRREAVADDVDPAGVRVRGALLGGHGSISLSLVGRRPGPGPDHGVPGRCFGTDSARSSGRAPSRPVSPRRAHGHPLRPRRHVYRPVGRARPQRPSPRGWLRCVRRPCSLSASDG